MPILATIPAEITTAFTDLDALWVLAKGFIITVGVFMLLWRFFRKTAPKAR